MPIIPRLQAPGPLDAAPSPVLDRERRPTVDSSREIAAVGALGRAGQMPLDGNDYSLRGLGAAGDAVMRAGSVIGAMVQKEREEKSRTAIIEAQAEMDVVNEVNGAFYSQNLKNTDAWASHAFKTAEDLKSRLLKDERLTKTDRERLGVQLGSWGKKQLIHAQTAGASTVYANSRKAISSRLANLRQAARFDEIPPMMEQAKASGAFYNWELEDEDFKTQEAVKTKTAEGIGGRYDIAVQTANEELLNQTINEGKTALGWDEDYAEARRLKGMEGIEQTKEANKRQRESEVIGDLELRRARGEVIVPSQIESLIQSGDIDKQTGARLLVTFKSDLGAMPGEFMDFLNKEVDAYDPDSDEKGLKWLELNKKADLLGLDKNQRGLYAMRFERAAKVNADPKLKPLEAVRRAAKGQIGEMFKDVGTTNVWADNLEGALQDAAKLEAWGLDATARDSIKTTLSDDTRKPEDRNQAALRIFKEASKKRTDKTASGLTEWEHKLYERAETDNEETQFDAKFTAEFNLAILEEGFDNWYDSETAKRGAPPSDVEARQWVGDKTRAVIQGSGAANLFKTTTPTPVTSFNQPSMNTPNPRIDLDSVGGFGVTTQTREEVGPSTLEARQVSLDFNDASSTTARGIEIIIPDDATAKERAAAQDYVSQTQQFFAAQGVTVPVRGVKTRSENGRGTAGRFHTEPFFVGDAEALAAMQKDPAGYAAVLAGTLGKIPGVTFIAPHKANDPGATRGSVNERDFARQFILPHLEKLRTKS